jgi:hypothetical protein
MANPGLRRRNAFGVRGRGKKGVLVCLPLWLACLPQIDQTECGLPLLMHAKNVARHLHSDNLATCPVAFGDLYPHHFLHERTRFAGGTPLAFGEMKERCCSALLWLN